MEVMVEEEVKVQFLQGLLINAHIALNFSLLMRAVNSHPWHSITNQACINPFNSPARSLRNAAVKDKF